MNSKEFCEKYKDLMYCAFDNVPAISHPEKITEYLETSEPFQAGSKREGASLDEFFRSHPWGLADLHDVTDVLDDIAPEISSWIKHSGVFIGPLAKILVIRQKTAEFLDHYSLPYVGPIHLDQPGAISIRFMVNNTQNNLWFYELTNKYQMGAVLERSNYSGEFNTRDENEKIVLHPDGYSEPNGNGVLLEPTRLNASRTTGIIINESVCAHAATLESQEQPKPEEEKFTFVFLPASPVGKDNFNFDLLSDIIKQHPDTTSWCQGEIQ